MADSKISAYAALTGANVDPAIDLLEIVDTSVTTNKKITVTELDTALWNKTTHTLGADFTATRAAGTVAAGTVQGISWASSFTGDAGGTTDYRGFTHTLTTAGANAITNAFSTISIVDHAVNVTIAAARGSLNRIDISGAGTATIASGFSSSVRLTSSGNIATLQHFVAISPTLSSTGAITNSSGFYASDQGHATLVGSAYGFQCEDMTASVTRVGAFRGGVSSGTNKYNLYIDGTAQNLITGVTGIGVAPSSTAALTLVASTTSVASLRVAHGSAPTSPVNGDIWTTTAGLYVRINGATVGPLS